MRKSKLYPITYSMVTDRRYLLPDIFMAVRPHKGAFIGVSELEGCFLCDEQEKLFRDIVIGEKLTLLVDETTRALLSPRLNVYRSDGTLLGMLPYSASLLPNALLRRDIKVWCHAEAKDFTGGMLSVAVSLYCEEY